MKIYTLAGEARVGKDSFCDFAMQMVSTPKVKKVAIADKLKTFLHNYMSVPLECMYGSTEQKNAVIGTWGRYIYDSNVLDKFNVTPDAPITSRQLMQAAGTDVFRNAFGPDFWINSCIKDIKTKYQGLDYIFVCDVRFPNEFYKFKQLGAKIIKMYRDTGLKSMAHASESALDEVPDTDYDYIIHEENNKSLKALKLQVAQILHKEGVLV